MEAGFYVMWQKNELIVHLSRQYIHHHCGNASQQHDPQGSWEQKQMHKKMTKSWRIFKVRLQENLGDD